MILSHSIAFLKDKMESGEEGKERKEKKERDNYIL
jgi:hypothetical protein